MMLINGGKYVNKKLTELFQGYGLEVTGNHAYGVIEGYETNVEAKGPQFYFTICFYANDETKSLISKEIKNLKLSFFSHTMVSTGLQFSKNDWTVGTFVKNFPNALSKIIAILNKYEVPGITHCPLCGEELDLATSQKYTIENTFITLDEKCVESINTMIKEENEAFENAPNNYLRGTLGACVGAIVGVIVLVILFFLGYISSLSVIVGIALGTFLYKQFGGKPTKIMVGIVSVINLVAMLLAIYILYYRAAGVLAPDYGFSSTGMEAFRDMMSVEEFSNEFIMNMAMTALFSVLGAAIIGFSMFKSLKREKPVK